MICSVNVVSHLPFTGEQSVHSAEEAPYLLLEDLHYNHTRSNTHSAKHTLTDQPSEAETRVETAADTHSEADAGAHTAILVQLQQVLEVQAAGTERYEDAVTHSGCCSAPAGLLLLS